MICDGQTDRWTVRWTHWEKQSKGNNFKCVQARVMVIVHDTSSHCALKVYGVSLKYN